MLRMLDRYAVQKLLRAGVKAREVAREMGISLRSVRRIAREAPVGDAEASVASNARMAGRPG
ncbi:MAG: helix-turn-helix domain-containing protein, partial [Gemmatimonadaceae bacterium]